MLRVYTEDTFDRYQNDKQAQKAAFMLAVNAREVNIQSLIVKLMQRLQIEADRLHRSEKGHELQNQIQWTKASNYSALITHLKRAVQDA